MSVTIRTCGGVGNQMAQRAFGYSLEAFGNEVFFDLSWFNNSDTRAYALDHWNVEIKFGPIRGQCVQEPSLRHHPEVLKKYDQDVTLIGYWQAYKYREGVEDRIRKEFTLRQWPSEKSLAVANQIHNSNSVFLHVRRTDTLSQRGVVNHGPLAQSYYQRAASFISTRVQDPHFFIFSDDVEWCKQNIQVFNYPVTFVDHNSTGVTVQPGNEVQKTDSGQEHEDLWLMSRCKHGITANSSFSWWGAWLQQNPDKLIVVPTQWFSTGSPHDSSELIPPTWVKL